MISSGKIRCGYVIYPPGSIKDPNTGKLSGVFVDAMQAAADNLELKLEWTEEVGWGSMIEGLKTDRYDMICSQVWANSSRGKVADFTIPLIYSGIGIYVRADDGRFTDNLNGIDSPKVKISTIDGEMTDIIASSSFPKATRVSLPQMSDVAQVLLQVVEKKADITFVEPYIANQFLKSHPGTLKNIAQERPIRLFGNTMMFRKGEEKLKSMMNTAFQELINGGHVETLLNRYVPDKTSFYRPAYPYRVDF